MTEDNINNFNYHIKEVSERIIDCIKDIEEDDLNGEWQSNYWNYLMQEQGSPYSAVEDSAITGKGSRFYSDIIKRENYIKGKLLLWQEEFLTKEYGKAKAYCEEIRISDGIGDSQIYEYLLLTYVKGIGANNLIQKYLSLVHSSDFQKLLLYLERTLSLDGKTDTFYDSLMDIYVDLMNAIRRYYQNISHDYLLRAAQKGRSQKRNIIQGCIEATILIYNYFYKYLNESGFHPIIEDLIVEIEGGGKYDWLKIQKDELINKTNYNSLEKREHLLEIYKSTKSDSNISEHLYEKLKTKKEILDNTLAAVEGSSKFMNTCKIAYFIYREDRFVELLSSISISQITSIKMQKTILNSLRTDINSFEDKPDFDAFENDFLEKMEYYGNISKKYIPDNSIENPLNEGINSSFWKQFCIGIKIEIQYESKIKIYLFFIVIVVTLLIYTIGFFYYGFDFLVISLWFFLVEVFIFICLAKHVDYKKGRANR